MCVRARALKTETELKYIGCLSRFTYHIDYYQEVFSNSCGNRDHTENPVAPSDPLTKLATNTEESRCGLSAARGGEHENQARHVDTRAVSTCCQPEAR